MRMGKTLLPLLLAGLLALAACVPSQHRFYTKRDLVLNTNLEGVWYRAGQDKPAWIFTKTKGGDHYTAVLTDDEGATFTAHLFRISNHSFIDLAPGEVKLKGANEFYKFHLRPAHTLMRVWIEQDELRLVSMDPKAVDEILKAKPDAVEHEVGEDEEDCPLLLTAKPLRLQAFVLAHEEKIFGKPERFRHKPFKE